MSSLVTANVAELIEHLGVPPERIRMRPLPGQATEADVLKAEPRCELMDAVLMERAMGYYEARVAAVLIYFLEVYLEGHDLGMVLGADGMMRLEEGQVRIPDVPFYAWEHFPNRLLPNEQILSHVPDLAVEIRVDRPGHVLQRPRALGAFSDSDSNGSVADMKSAQKAAKEGTEAAQERQTMPVTCFALRKSMLGDGVSEALEAGTEQQAAPWVGFGSLEPNASFLTRFDKPVPATRCGFS